MDDEPLPTPAEAPLRVTRGDVSLLVRSTPTYRAFWERVDAGNWEPGTFATLDRFVRSEATYVDIGAWIGPTVLYAAHGARQVVAFEPDPVAFGELEANLALNPDLASRVAAHNCCLGPQSGTVSLYSGGLHHDAESVFGDSMSSLVASGDAESQQAMNVSSMTFDEVLGRHDLGPRCLVKMDIEGGEYLLLPSMASYFATQRPTLFISLHLPSIEDRAVQLPSTLALLADLFPRIYSTRGQLVPVAEILRMEPDWSCTGADNPAAHLFMVARNGLVATWEEW